MAHFTFSLVDALAFYGPAGLYPGTLATTPFDNIVDLSAKLSYGEGKVVSRAYKFEHYAPLLGVLSLEWNMNDDLDDAAVGVLRAACFSRTPLSFLFKDHADGHTLEGVFHIFGFDDDQKLSDVGGFKITIKPAAGYADPVLV